MTPYEPNCMTVNFEVKGSLARLLATENLIVENKQVETASFNVETRVLTLPMWEFASNQVYDMLVSHEVGHALFTPDEDWDSDIPQSFLNVVEDVRIERLMKRKFGGISKTFYRGYQELQEKDFFELSDTEVSKMNIADRINLYYKVGNFIDIPFTEEEEDFVRRADTVETFREVQDLAKDMSVYCKEQTSKNQNIQVQDLSNGGSSSAPQASSEITNSEQLDNFEEPMSSLNEESSNGSTESDIQDTDIDDNELKEELNAKTDELLTKKIQNLVNKSSSPNSYIEIPQLNLDTVINSNKEVHDYINDHFSVFTEDDFQNIDRQYNHYKKNSQKEVNYLVKEFECRKSADNYVRTSTSRTGVLDCSKLHTYKHNEDLFKKVTIIPDGKNHGLIFLLDWSGSMGNVIEDTLKQLYNLIWFCKKVGIPFGVYSFTYEFNIPQCDQHGNELSMIGHYEKKQGLFFVDDRFSLMELFNSNTSIKQLDHQMKNIWRVVKGSVSWVKYSVPPRMSLSGTPLNETLITLHQLIPTLQKKWKIQKLQCVILTDGESNHLRCHRMINRDWENRSYLGTRYLRVFNDYLRNRKTGKTYQITEKFWEFTSMMLKNLKDEFTQVNFIGIRIIESRGANEFIRRYTSSNFEESDRLMREWKKNKTISMNVTGYEKYFGLGETILNQNTEFYVDEGSSKSKIKSAFTKSLKTKKLNKKILSEFVEIIA